MKKQLDRISSAGASAGLKQNPKGHGQAEPTVITKKVTLCETLNPSKEQCLNKKWVKETRAEVNKAKAQGIEPVRDSMVPDTISNYATMYLVNKGRLQENQKWYEVFPTVSDLITELEKYFGESVTTTLTTIEQQLAEVKWHVSRTNQDWLALVSTKWTKIIGKRELTEVQVDHILKNVERVSLKSPDGENKALYEYVRTKCFGEGERPKTITQLFTKMMTIMDSVYTSIEIDKRTRDPSLDRDKSHQGRNAKRKRDTESESTKDDKSSSPCTKCGWKGKCETGACWMYKHPNANRDSCKWDVSKWAPKLLEQSWSRLPTSKALKEDGTLRDLTTQELDAMPRAKEYNALRANKSKHASKKAKHVSDIFHHNNELHQLGLASFNPLVHGRINSADLGKDEQEAYSLPVGSGILDSGSFGYIANYISVGCFKRLAQMRVCKSHTCRQTKVCTMHNCFSNNKCTTLRMEVYSETVKRSIEITFEARVVRGLPYDFIIGLPTIRRFKLTKVFDYMFNDNDIVEGLHVEPISKHKLSQAVETTCKKELDPETRGPMRSTDSEMKTQSCRERKRKKPSPAGLQRKPSSTITFRADTAVPGVVEHPTKVPSQPSLARRSLGNGTICRCEKPHTLWCASCSSQLNFVFDEEGPADSTLYGRYRSSEIGPLLKYTYYSDNQTIAMMERLELASMRNVGINCLNPIFSKDDFIDMEDDTDHLDEYLEDSPHDRILNQEKPSMKQGFDSVQFYGTESFQIKTKTLMKKYKGRLQEELSPNAALVEAFVLELKNDVKGKEWLDATVNKQASRPQTAVKEAAIREFVKKALEMGVIEPSQATSWSQVHLIPKTNGKWRFCIDFRRLNEATKSLGWPLPNIKEMLQRIGARKPKHFAVLDLTQGYYQAAISKESRPLTAFRTSTGLYQWTRLPMGLKGAPAYFQHAMQNYVLRDLLYTSCEVYLDDIIVYGETEDEFLENLDKVFSRLEKYNITLNPEKVKIGMPSVEYVGHTIDGEGLSFSSTKREDVWNAPLPITKKQLKSFLGLCVQFKDHVRNYSTLVQPLHNLLPKYSKKDGNKPVVWTNETRTLFEEVKKAVNECPKLFFFDVNAPVFLHTDASDYGIGGYLFQVVDGIIQPIQFLSRSLSKTERKWSTYEKEGYAIFYSLMKMEHLIRDSHFTLRTDHRNLTFINTDLRDKVKRWKLTIQHFDFDIEHIEGVKNVEADGFSRIITIPEEEELQEDEIDVENLFVLREFMTPRLPPDVYKLIREVHNSNVGHFGLEKTLSRLKDLKHEWKGMRAHVKTFIDKCPCCQKMSTLKPLIHTKPYTLAAYAPFERICVDTIGPLPTDTDNGNEHILVIIDAFSRFVMLKAIPDTSARSALTGLLDWVGMFGIPSEMVSDNGTQFANELIAQFLDFRNYRC